MVLKQPAINMQKEKKEKKKKESNHRPYILQKN